MAVTFVTSAPLLLADDPATAPDGNRIVPVTVGGHTLPIEVRDSDPYKNVTTPKSSGKYDPLSLNFSASSSMANKKFDSTVNSFSQSNTVDQHQSFVTKAYSDDGAAPTAPNLHTKAAYSDNAGFHKTASDTDKGYATRADASQDQTALLAKTNSDEQNHTALLKAKPIDTPAATIGDKTFEGSEADAMHRHLSRTTDGKIAISDLPDRALTIDEVKNLINHGFKPNTEAKPEEQSKPLNDPARELEPLRVAPAPATDDDKNDAVPPPGTMAAPQPPENSEPLPKQ